MRRTLPLMLALALILAAGAAVLGAVQTERPAPVSLASREVDGAVGESVVSPGATESGTESASSQPLVETTLDRLPAAPTVVEVNRVTVPPGARLPGLIGPGPELLVLEAGRLVVQVTGEARVSGAAGSTTVGGDVLLQPGHFLIVATGGPFAIENSGQVTAIILELALRSTAERSPENEGIDATALGDAGLVPGVSVQRLAGGLAPHLTSGPATIDVARLTVAPGAGVAPREVVEAELIAIEAGTGDLTIAAGEGQLQLATGPELFRAPAGDRSDGDFWGRPRSLTAGEGAFFPHGAAYTIRNLGSSPLVLLVVRITPAGAVGG